MGSGFVDRFVEDGSAVFREWVTAESPLLDWMLELGEPYAKVSPSTGYAEDMGSAHALAVQLCLIHKAEHLFVNRENDAIEVYTDAGRGYYDIWLLESNHVGWCGASRLRGCEPVVKAGWVRGCFAYKPLEEAAGNCDSSVETSI